jgi:hypothetical protein
MERDKRVKLALVFGWLSCLVRLRFASARISCSRPARPQGPWHREVQRAYLSTVCDVPPYLTQISAKFSVCEIKESR